jgi:hypothetical protein
MQDWVSAATAYMALAAGDSTNGRYWFRLGSSLRALSRYQESKAALERSLELGFPPRRFVAFELARVLAGSGAPDSAISWLDQAVEAGYSNVQSIGAVPELTELKEDVRFSAILTRADSVARPCEYDSRRRVFDFWIGEWEVRGANGPLFGTNTIRKAEQGCVLIEEWSGAGGGTGTSINYYDPATDVWVQEWVSSNATLIRIEGGFDDGSMRMEGHILSGSGPRRPFRGVWTPLEDGRVRQYFEQSNDEGRTWAPWFEGFYSRMDASD